MDNKLIINDSDCVFSVLGTKSGDATRTVVFGDDANRLELNITLKDNFISSIDCIYLKDIMNEKISLLDIRNTDTIGEFVEASSYYKQKDVSGFIVNFNRDELDIILSDSLTPTLYFADGRVEYYYDKNLDLIYIKIIDLSEDEYEYFKSLSETKKVGK